MRNCVRAIPLFLCVITLCSCSGQPDHGELETYPITGEVFVDGQAAAQVQVTFQNASASGTPTSATTDENGKFSASTYESEDGAPEGEYVVTFAWSTMNVMTKRLENDKLKGLYSDPEKSEFKVSVNAGEPADMGRIDLKTK